MLYGADGSLLQRKYLKNNAQISKTDYLRGKEYKSDILESIYHKDGRVIQKGGNTYQYEYHIKDHLGNVRVTFEDMNANGIISSNEIKSRNDYYSFGMEWNNRWELSDTISPVNKYRYNGKEYVEEMGWHNLDFGARMMDPILGIFPSIDRFAEKFPWQSPYSYAGNNPIKFIDINGDSIDVYNPNGQYVRTFDDGKKGFSGIFYQNTTTDECGNMSFCDGLSFTYNDPSEDRKSVLQDGYKVELASLKDIQNMVLDGVRGSEYPYRYAYNEGQAGGKLDFFVQNSTRIPEKTLSLITDLKGGTVGYNPKDYGNFMFGLSMRFLSIPLSEAKAGAHFNNMVNGRRDGGDKWQLLDSKGDQRAITNGFNLNIKHQKKVR